MFSFSYVTGKKIFIIKLLYTSELKKNVKRKRLECSSDRVYVGLYKLKHTSHNTTFNHINESNILDNLTLS